MSLLAGAGEIVLWCMAGVIGAAVVAVVTLYVWDWWYSRQIMRGRK